MRPVSAGLFAQGFARGAPGHPGRPPRAAATGSGSPRNALVVAHLQLWAAAAGRIASSNWAPRLATLSCPWAAPSCGAGRPPAAHPVPQLTGHTRASPLLQPSTEAPLTPRAGDGQRQLYSASGPVSCRRVLGAATMQGNRADPLLPRVDRWASRRSSRPCLELALLARWPSAVYPQKRSGTGGSGLGG